MFCTLVKILPIRGHCLIDRGPCKHVYHSMISLRYLGWTKYWVTQGEQLSPLPANVVSSLPGDSGVRDSVIPDKLRKAIIYQAKIVYDTFFNENFRPMCWLWISLSFWFTCVRQPKLNPGHNTKCGIFVRKNNKG